jgi:hypothetical protein
MILFAIFMFVSVSAHNGTRNFDECKAVKFKPSSCWESEQLYKAGKWGCKVQGKKYVGKDAGNNNGCSEK